MTSVSDIHDIYKACDSITPLHVASRHNDVQAVTYFLMSGVNVNVVTQLQSTPLHWAAGANALEVIKLLLRKGAHINHQNQGGCSPLHWAAYNGHLGAAKLLCSYPSCDIHLKNYVGVSPLERARGSEQLDTGDVVEFLSNVPANHAFSGPPDVRLMKREVSNTAVKYQGTQWSETFAKLETRLEDVETKVGKLNIDNRSASIKENRQKLEEEASAIWREHKALLDKTREEVTSEGVPNDIAIYRVASSIVNEQTGLGVLLGLEIYKVRQIQRENDHCCDVAVNILTTWRDKDSQLSKKDKVEKLKGVLEEIGKRDLIRHIAESQ